MKDEERKDDEENLEEGVSNEIAIILLIGIVVILAAAVLVISSDLTRLIDNSSPQQEGFEIEKEETYVNIQSIRAAKDVERYEVRLCEDRYTLKANSTGVKKPFTTSSPCDTVSVINPNTDSVVQEWSVEDVYFIDFRFDYLSDNSNSITEGETLNINLEVENLGANSFSGESVLKVDANQDGNFKKVDSESLNLDVGDVKSYTLTYNTKSGDFDSIDVRITAGPQIDEEREIIFGDDGSDDGDEGDTSCCK